MTSMPLADAIMSNEKPPQQSLFGPMAVHRTQPKKPDPVAESEAIKSSVRVIPAKRDIPMPERFEEVIPDRVESASISDKVKMPVMATYAVTIVHYVATFALAAFNCIFFVQLAGDDVLLKLIFGLTAVIFAFGEVGLWERGLWTGGSTGRVYKACAIGLALFSFLGGAASSLTEVTRYDVASFDAAAIDAEITALDRRQIELESRLSELPATWVTRASEIQKDIQSLSDQRAELRAKKEAGVKGQAQAGESVQIFVLLSRVFRCSVGTVALVFLLFRSAMIEVVALATSKTPSRENKVKA